MIRAIILSFFCFPLLISGQNHSKLTDFDRYIGDWYTVPDSAMLKQFPETKDMIGFRFEWENDQKKVLRYYEGIPGGKVEDHILKAMVTENPRTGDLEFLGYQMRNDYLFKGSFEFENEGKTLVRLYDVYYPPETKFRSQKDSAKGMISYRDICHLKGNDTMECRVERREGNTWKPWGNGKPFYMVRKALPAHPIPDWVLENWETHTKGTGVWITDNSKYKGENEPFEAYGMHWEWGLGKTSIKGRLYGIQDGKDIGTFWQFINYWDPATQQHKMVQIGSNGTVGEGHFYLQDDGSTRSWEKFANPEGGSFEIGHHSWFEDGAMHTQSFDVRNGNWEKRRFYIWEPQKEDQQEVPLAYKDLAFLIGEWKSSFGESSASMRFSWGENRRFIRYENGYRKSPSEPEQLESSGIVTYHGVKEQIVFTNTYLRKGTHLISEGYYKIDPGERFTANLPATTKKETLYLGAMVQKQRKVEKALSLSKFGNLLMRIHSREIFFGKIKGNGSAPLSVKEKNMRKSGPGRIKLIKPQKLSHPFDETAFAFSKFAAVYRFRPYCS